ncbi:MAG: sulfatase-like hydrolase/transferase, partial [Verrucomicrobiota bacterium]
DFSNGEYGPDIASDYLCEFLERNKDEEFFAYYPMIPPHFPFQPTPDSEEWDPTESREYPKSEWRDEWFQDMVKYTDKVVGKLVDKLEDLGLRENTLIIFTGDNGTYAGMESQFQGGTWVGGKGKPKDSGTRVPLVVNWPGTTPEGQVSQSLVDFSDMMPTIAEAAGINVPKNWKIDGRSFAPEVKGEGTAPRDYIYCWYERDGRRGKASEHTRTQRHKLYGDGSFFDVVADFEEKNPINTSVLEGNDLKTYQMLKRKLEKHMSITDDSDEAQGEKRDQLQRNSKEQTKTEEEA